MQSDDCIRVFNAAGLTYREAGASFLDHFAKLLIDALDVQPGNHVVDLATGPGTVAKQLSARVGSAGSVIGIDLADRQLEIARDDSTGPSRFLHMDATALTLPDHAVDAVTCGFGLPYFDDPARAVREASRILRPGGRLSFSTWSEPWFGTAGDILTAAFERHEALNVRGRYTYTPDQLAQLCFAAGLRDVIVEAHALPLAFPSFNAWWVMNLAFAFLIPLETLEPEQQADFRADLEASTALRTDDGAIATSMDVYLLRATT